MKPTRGWGRQLLVHLPRLAAATVRRFWKTSPTHHPIIPWFWNGHCIYNKFHSIRWSFSVPVLGWALSWKLVLRVSFRVILKHFDGTWTLFRKSSYFWLYFKVILKYFNTEVSSFIEAYLFAFSYSGPSWGLIIWTSIWWSLTFWM